MKTNGKKYFLYLLSILLILTAGVVLVLGENYFNWVLAIPGFFLIMGIVFYYLAEKLSAAPNNRFLSYYLIITFSKFILAIVGLILYMVFIKEQKVAFVIAFFIYYIVFSVFETRILLKINKSNCDKK